MGVGALNSGAKLSIEKVSIPIKEKNVSTYKITIYGYKDWIIEKGALPEFYVHKNNIYYYESNGMLRKGSTK